MDNTYDYSNKEADEAQLEHNTVSDIAESFLPLASFPGNIRRIFSTNDIERHNRTR